MHMPKTGGSTLRNVIRDQYISSEILSYDDNQDNLQKKLNDVDITKLKIVHGHYFFGIHEHLQRPFSYFTILRHPIERVLSLYYYLKSINGKKYDVYRKMTLDEFIEKKIEENIQTAYLSGSNTQPSILKAARNLHRYFDVVGTTENFDETLYLIGKRYGWKNLHYNRVNVTKSRLSSKEISEKTKKLIRKVHHKDLLLYKYAQKKLTIQIRELDEHERKELEQFKKAQLTLESK